MPPHDQTLADTIAEVERVERMPFDRGVSTGLIREISESVHANYIAANLAAVSPPAIPGSPSCSRLCMERPTPQSVMSSRRRASP